MKYQGLRYIDLLRLKEEKYLYFTLEESLEAVKEDGYKLKYVKHQTPKICLEAVRKNGWALQYIINQTEEICKEAYKRNPDSIRYIRIDIKDEELIKIRENYFKFFTEEESLKAVKENGFNLAYVKHQTPEICLEAVKQNGYDLRFVHNQTEEICLEAYKQHPDSIQFIGETLETYRKRRLNLIKDGIY